MTTIRVINTETKEVVVELRFPSFVSFETAQRAAQILCESFDKKVGETALHAIGAAQHANNIGRKPRGACTVCGGEFPLTADGRLSRHGKKYGEVTKKHCTGSCRPPA